MACRYLKEGERADALERLESHTQLADLTAKAELDYSRIIKVGHDVLNMECRVKFKCELKVRRLNDLKEEVPWIGCQGCSKGWQFFTVGPEDDTPFQFFEAGTTIFFPREDDMVNLQAKPLFRRDECSR
ncbi:hypothetical protein GOBAR_AA26244 [Gossypium barbadense]|uniref:Uncharacterized protein n=1 Tax=Gossypium barbadense TaxID=3634 RepID=A0A2P5WTM6_GOSBA|nr:hypothetical protein GOBAR_AA26244 [Gossypium barbadense]